MGTIEIMASSFKDTIAKLGYEILKREGEDVIIQKKDELATILILFSGKEKHLTGAIQTNKLIYTLDEISHQYAIFREMKQDLKTFKQLSGYDIID